METLTRREQASFHAHLTVMYLESKRYINWQYWTDADGKLLRDPDVIYARRVRFISTNLEARTDTIQWEILKGLEKMDVYATPGALPTVQEVESVRERWQATRGFDPTTFPSSYYSSTLRKH